MTFGQKIVLLIMLMAAAGGGMYLRYRMFGQFDMGDNAGTFGLIASLLAFLFGGAVATLFPELFY
ncbi:hypothetical protein [Pararhizobium arenae]|uniref:hypothetical protein n=1 Tax=Pararhizobium arenae TaxID=1856850 RepID=UPI00094A9E51|nr:hypothetical protein [Pararhizobium arenae]